MGLHQRKENYKNIVLLRLSIVCGLKAQPTNAFFATVNQMFGGSSQLSFIADLVVIKSYGDNMADALEDFF